ncbi:LEAF RUST 10 DISEASE-RESISTANCEUS RECEPTOR-LIKE PROTEIN KINASE-like 1.2 [Spinacia oleracea]|uniref:non-specific serine/threonine protein kinase n=1 Tax=Spinacia oleracea TaxID=3562 RepID=A0ABM3RTG6_SPIOL|nr:LEAF RUST 10 DISEASE-RESISTANCE LOCUS RECEPTOR-LIKE PROTEIN KINASE-like 1.2 [Spinacia oleracea]
MGSCFVSQHITLIIVLLAVWLSNGEDPKYAACSLPFSCGKIRNVGYPFWSDDRPEYCGVPQFKLRCHDVTINDEYPKMNVFSGTENIRFRVFGINTSSHSMVVSLDKSCVWEKGNKTFLYPTVNPEAYRNISLFYGCGDHCATSNSFKCNRYDGSEQDTVYYFDDPTDTSSKGSKPCSCRSNVTFPVDKRVFEELRSSTKASLWSVLNKWPNITIQYKVNFTACSDCERSGGRCGSSEVASPDSASSKYQFSCYCPDGNGTHSLVCPHHQPMPLFTPKVKSKKLGKALGLGVGGLFVLIAAITGIWYLNKSKSDKTRSASLDSSESDLEEGSKYCGVSLFSYRELVAATDNFDQSKELGSGGFGTVYHGKLKDGREVAVKRLYEKNHKRMAQFMNEVQILTGLRHKNLVSIYGCTSPAHCKELLLVYEYVENGTVADHLYGENTTSGLLLLPWPIRMRIAIETATALSYLHASDIIHRDVKTNNILLDSNFSVKVADFGLSRLFPTDKTHVSTAPQGTPGYLDPEYHQCYRLTDKSDVYSFGVVLVELISSLPAIDMDRQRLEINLSNYAMNRIQRCAFDELVDPQLGSALDFKVRRMTISVAELAFQCLQHDKGFRPSMNEVLEALLRIQGADYEALQSKEMAKMHTSNPPLPSPTEEDHARLLSNHQLHPLSPMSVMDSWVSGSTMSSNSK